MILPENCMIYTSVLYDSTSYSYRVGYFFCLPLALYLPDLPHRLESCFLGRKAWAWGYIPLSTNFTHCTCSCDLRVPTVYEHSPAQTERVSCTVLHLLNKTVLHLLHGYNVGACGMCVCVCATQMMKVHNKSATILQFWYIQMSMDFSFGGSILLNAMVITPCTERKIHIVHTCTSQWVKGKIRALDVLIQLLI